MRYGKNERKTKETNVCASINLDGKGSANIEFPAGFFAHMLEAFSLWGKMDIELMASGDTWVDLHHVVEDSGIVLGRCLRTALGDKCGIERTGCAYVPMDEALTRVVVDISGRSFFCLSGSMPERVIYGSGANFQVSLIEDFWLAFCANAGITMHFDILRARSSHHVVEAIFKAAGMAMRNACMLAIPAANPKVGCLYEAADRVLSSKGVIE